MCDVPPNNLYCVKSTVLLENSRVFKVTEETQMRKLRLTILHHLYIQCSVPSLVEFAPYFHFIIPYLSC